MIRTVIRPNKNRVSFNITDKYIGKKMEVIAFAIDEPSEDVIYAAKSRKSFVATTINTSGFKFDRNEANER